MIRIIDQPGQTGSAATGLWTKLLDVGPLFHFLLLDWVTTPIALADIYLIQYLINGTIYWSLTGAQLDAINQRDGVPAFGSSGLTLVIPFDLMDQRDPRMRELTAINTGVRSPVNGKIISTHQIKITLNPSANQNFGILAGIDAQTPDGPGLVRRFSPYQKGAIASTLAALQPSVFTELDFGTNQWAYFRRIWTAPDSGLVLAQGLKASSGNIWGNLITTTASEAASKAYGHQALAAAFQYCLDFGVTGSGYTAVPKVAPADPKNPSAAPVILSDTGNNPYLNTIPLRDQTLTLQTVNDTGSINNNFLLEALGEID